MTSPVRHVIVRAALAVIFLLALYTSPRARACPFCSAVSNTFSEDIATMDAVVIARLTDYRGITPGTPPPAPGISSINSSSATFDIATILKGESLLKNARSFSTPFFGDAKKGDLFLVMGSDPQELSWSPPLRLNERQHQYLLALVRLPKQGPQRLAFFQQYLQDPDPMLAQDAYDEFARAPYDAVKQLKDRMDHDQLVKWIQDPEVSSSQRRLYFTMLGVCGSEEDLPMLERRMRSEDAQFKSGLDALIACYLTLRGSEGVALVEDLFLKKRDDNFSDAYPDVYAAIMALRFHGTQADVIPRQRVLKAFHYLLDNPPMADLVISDLARWQDWSQLEQLVKLFKTADTKSTFVRMPIINYMRACPLPEAKKALAEFEQIDPEAVKRAMTFFPTLPGDETKDPADSEG
jgi:hypothetical protein